jgi:hypothetical protein
VIQIIFRPDLFPHKNLFFLILHLSKNLANIIISLNELYIKDHDRVNFFPYTFNKQVDNIFHNLLLNKFLHKNNIPNLFDVIIPIHPKQFPSINYIKQIQITSINSKLNLLNLQ